MISGKATCSCLSRVTLRGSVCIDLQRADRGGGPSDNLHTRAILATMGKEGERRWLNRGAGEQEDSSRVGKTIIESIMWEGRRTSVFSIDDGKHEGSGGKRRRNFHVEELTGGVKNLNLAIMVTEEPNVIAGILDNLMEIE
ncbi:eukaryotic translation initiation factor 3subunit B [Striga asiatica]|uniref:Eukaryotic translation initiation factor 3subunit B n=1 Tax=Striga asiatica TaxID=4170 RepID=A0A5A7QX07_STRAF|nr:eukaryotic translation initiation factor 3subunit B [Striga asiatica]